MSGPDDAAVADSTNTRIEVFSVTGPLLTLWGSLGSGAYQFGGVTPGIDSPRGVWVDGTGKIYAADDSISTFIKTYGP